MSEDRLRVFLDTNVLFSAFYSRASVPGRLANAASEGTFLLVSSTQVFDELVGNLRQKLPEALLGLEAFMASTEIELYPNPPEYAVEPWTARGLGSDSIIFAAAVAADVDVFCTGDRPLLSRLADVKTPRVLTPRQLLDLLTPST